VRLKCDGTHAETRSGLSAKWTSPFKSAVVSVQSTAGSRGVRISGSNAGYTKFRGSVKRCEGVSVQSTAGSRGVRISGSNAGYTKFRGSVKRCEGDWLPTPFASFPFTSPPMHHRVPSRFNWTLPILQSFVIMSARGC